MSSPVLPGRLGSPDMSLRDDPRADPRMIAAMEPFGLSDRAAPAPVDASSPIEDLLEFVSEAEQGFETMFAAVAAGMPDVEGVERSVEVIKGLDGNDVTVYIHRPADRPDALPGVLHLHGGGMVMLEAAGATYGNLRDELAAAGLVVVGVEFRNGGGKHGPHPFPAGLNDCAAALRWVIDHKASLGIDKLIVAGESGGGNLTLATTLRAKRDGLLDHVAGAYAMCPYISNTWASPAGELPSLFENDGYFIDVSMMGALAKVYDPSGDHASDPLAWPLPGRRRRPRWPASPRHLGEPARPAARRGSRVRPQAARCRRVSGQPHRERHVPRRRPHLLRRHARRVRGDDPRRQGLRRLAVS